MRLSFRTCAAALALLALTAGSASAGGSFQIGTAPGTTEADCTRQGGTVVTNAQSEKICKLPRPVSTGSVPGREPTN